jgi:hypothetical protein
MIKQKYNVKNSQFEQISIGIGKILTPALEAQADSY